MDRNALVVATGVGLILQLAMVVAGHFSDEIKGLFAYGGMGISLIAGVFFTGLARPRLMRALTGGALAGGICALLAIAVSVALGDVDPMILVVGTFASLITGAIGGAFGKLIAR